MPDDRIREAYNRGMDFALRSAIGVAETQETLKGYNLTALKLAMASLMRPEARATLDDPELR